jgi:phosphoribosylaminoimidazolecarboxamide formyltransferase/IMP cyclohydrolase
VVIKHEPVRRRDGLTLPQGLCARREANPLSAFGGIVRLNRPIDLGPRTPGLHTFIEAVIAPGVSADEETRALLAQKPNLRWSPPRLTRWIVTAMCGPSLGRLIRIVIV